MSGLLIMTARPTCSSTPMVPSVVVPTAYVSDGQIVLNISPTAVVSLQMANDAVTFNGRFGGQPIDIYAPIRSIMGIYARENGQGMIFDDEPTSRATPTKPSLPSAYALR